MQCTHWLAAAILALGFVYWLIRDSDQRLDNRLEVTGRGVHRLVMKTGSFSSAARLAPGNTMLPEGSSSTIAKPQQLFTDFCDREGLECLDLLPRFS